MILSHPMIGYIIPFYTTPEGSFYAGISMENPEADVNPGFATRPGPYDSYSHIPDFATKLRWEDKVLGHLQAGALMRDIALENGANSFHRDTFGWGVRLSGALHPFSNCAFRDDTIFFAATYGEGIAAYIRDLAGDQDDAVIDATNHLKPLPVFAYYVGYTHNWTTSLRSSVVYSEVDLHNIAVPSDGFAYHRGRYISVNSFYKWNVQFGNDADQTKNVHTAYAGLEYLYGQKETISGAHGEDNRVQFTLGIKY